MQSISIFSKIMRFFVAFVVAVFLSCFESHADDCVLGTDGCAPEFTVTTTELSAGTTFSFKISAAGTYYIDWGDGGAIETIVKNSVGEQTITHTYTNTGQYTIGMAGQATLYSSSNAIAAISFSRNTNISGISGSLGAIFGTLTDRVNSDGTLMSDAQPRFGGTFYNCSGLSGSIPENLFAGISGAPADGMFLNTFFGCSNLSGNIPENLFAGISGAPAGFMFGSTFSGCSGLSGSIPENLFAGISGAPASYMFSATFQNCSKLSGSIPENLFAGISGAPASYMFGSTFAYCSNLSGSIPENLFAGISGAPADFMFGSTFYNCSGLSGSIPENLFAGISGAPASYMFDATFYGCRGLSGSIPENLFAGISGAPASYMFSNTFSNCRGLSGSIPENLFAGINGAPANSMFRYTFSNCDGLSGYVPANLFAGIDKTTTASDQMINVFYNTGLATSCPSGTYEYVTSFESYFNGKVACEVCPDNFPDSTFADNVTIDKCYTACPEKVDDPLVFGHKYYTIDGIGNTETCKYKSEIPEPEFTVTTTELSAETTFSFEISAAGTYYIDWGDGGAIETIVKDALNEQTITHTYANAGQYTIGMAGQATLYSTSNTTAAISFKNNTNISGISGSLGAIFGTLTDRVNSDGTLMSDAQPRFYYTFSGCSNLSGNIPENLFAGIKGKPADGMFMYTFSYCSNLSGNIPENLFAGISGAPADSMFSYTFYGCSGLSGSIPENLFAGISGAPAYRMFDGTFSGCDGLSGSIPENLFAGINGAPANMMFEGTFANCDGLSGSIPENLFAGISGAPADRMFLSTFSGSSGLSGSIPENLFAGIKGKPASYMFSYTFSYCRGLSGSIPGNLFAGIKGDPANRMFYQTFYYCSGLSGYVPANLFAGIDKTTTASDQMNYVFNGTGLETSCPASTYEYVTGFESNFNGKVACEVCPDNFPDSTSGDNATIDKCYTTCPEKADDPVVSGHKYYTIDGLGNAESCKYKSEIPEPEFTVTTTELSAGTTFSFKISAAGTYNIDWGDGGAIETIVKDAPNVETITHTYTNAGQYTIGMSGQATLYNTGTTTAAISFMNNTNISGISGSLGAIFGTLTDRVNSYGSLKPDAQPRFYQTFYNCTNLKGSIPENLFAGINGAPADSMFESTFSGCSNLSGSIPENLFAGISGAPAASMFSSTFSGCSSLSGNIPENLFAGIKGKPADDMLFFTFHGCSNLSGNIPENLFAGIKGAPASYMFSQTFSGCSGLSGNIPEKLFAGISGAPATNMFAYTFSDCSGLSGSIPENLFAGISGAPASHMFHSTFSNCSNLSGSIPENLFAGINGAPATGMFIGTFSNCSGLSGSIPANLFAGINGDPADSMFNSTFDGCSGLSGSIPENLFAGINGAPKHAMFMYTFSDCSGLSGSIPENLFAGISGAPADYMFYQTFSNCSGLSGYVPANLFAGIDKTTTALNQMDYVFSNTGLETSCPESMYQYLTGFESYFDGKVACEVCPDNFPDSTSGDNATIDKCYTTCPEKVDDPVVSGHKYYTVDGIGNAESCKYQSEIPEPEFTVTTTELSAGTTFSFKISAAGTYYIDWGDGDAIEAIVKNSVGEQTITHTYTNAGQYTIGMSGQATLYSTDNTTAAIMFSGNTNISGISGSLGAIFGTLTDRVKSDGTLMSDAQPRFDKTFYNCTNLKGSIPENLFAGIKGKPASYMFYSTFNGCRGLSGSIPENLFAGISGAPASYMFAGTFYNCSGLSGSIPENLFAGIKGTPASYMFYYTFDGCSNLSGNIPENLFAGISGAPARSMFYSTFDGCSGLSGSIPENLFAGISGAPADYMFNQTFYNCSGLSGSIPANLFAGINGAPASYMFNQTFYNCSGLSGSIPENLFAGIKGAPASYMFDGTFSGCDGLSGSIPENLFAGISGAPASYMFSYTFYNCRGLSGSIPENLFAGISGAPADSMFSGTFSDCYSLSGSIPENLFAGINGAPASSMFNYTFVNCRGLSGSIPEKLFAGIKGAPAYGMFWGTFQGCSNLSGSIPDNLFAGIKGKPASYMFYRTFLSCGVSGNIPENLFAGISGAPVDGMFSGTFAYCSNLSGNIPANLFAGIDKTTTASDQMTDVFNYTGLATSCPSDTYQYLTGFESYFSGRVACSACPADYPNSDSGATSENECYKTCEAEKVPGYVGVGNEYYGTDTCELTECADGWRNGGISDVIGTNQADKRGVVYPGYFSEDVWSGDYMGQDYYGISEVNSFAVDYGNNGMVKGRGICSTKQGEFNYDWGTNTLNVTTFDELDDETGNYDAQYCYCQVNEYVPSGGSLSQSVSGKWVFHPNYYSSDDCRYYCGSYCADMMVWSDDYQLSFRNAVLGGGSNSENQCKEILYNIPVGQYIVAGSTEPTKCPSGYYCPGMGDVRLSDDKDQGLVACPDGYDNSDTGAKTEADCYKPCVADDVPGAMSVTGKNYYGDGADTCAATECMAGWMVKDLTGTIKNASGSNSTYINNNGDITDSENKGLAYYGISDKNSFAVDYGKRGILTGHGRCSTQEGVYNFDWNTYTLTDVTVVDSLADETGMDGAQYCYCQVDGFTPVGELTQILSDQPWVYYRNHWDSGSCANDCVRACSELLRGNSDEGMAMRQVLFGPFMCVQASYRLNAGTYLPAGDDAPAKCPVGYYCPGVVNVKTDEENDQGLFQCPVDYPDSDEGAMGDTYCYTSCKLENMDVENAVAVAGKDYYGTGADTCVPSECAAGWIVQDLTGIAGQDYALNSAYITTNSGVVGLVDSNGRDMMYYGISELNSFALDFGKKGIITGRARCSTIEGTNNDYTWTDPTILDELADETGQSGAYHCYCQVDGFTMPNKVVQQVSGPWVYRSNYWGDYEYCASSCAGNCAQQLKYNNSDNMAFRKAMFVPTMCVQESYRINAGTYLPAGDDAPAKCPVGYYCPGVVNVKLDEENDQGLSKCPSEYPNSDTGATADTQCYTKCTINDVANSMTVVGDNYYGTGTDTCEATECAPGWLLDLGLGEYAVCADTLSYIEPGTYLPAGNSVVEMCLPGSYCPGADNVSYNVDADQGIFACPTEYPNSYTGAKADTECYQTCKIDNGDVTTSGNGNIYYGDENNTCELTECADGWMLKDFAKKIGTESGINSAYVSTNSMSYGQFVEEEWINDSVMGQMYYGISEPGEFAVGFGENGVITGRGRCSTKSGVKNYDWGTQEFSEITTFDELDDESGNDDARYCYCHVDSYTSVGGLTQVLSGMPWVFNSESWSGEGCNSYCAAECVSYLRNIYDDQGIAFRAVAFGAKPEDPAICIEESYRLNPGMYLMAGEDTPTKCPSGSYCPGAGDVILNSDKNQGIVKCPSGYPYSDTGATDDTQCYSLCTTDDVANSTSVIGNDYYGDGTDTCAATQCVAGWKLRDLSAIIGNIPGANSAYISTNSSSYGEFRDSAGLDQDYYGISEIGSFAVDYGDTGIITGRARCSTKPGVGGTNPTVFKELDDESGVDGAQYCYCQVNGYFKQGELIQAISGPWVYHGSCSSDGTSMCEDSCSSYLKWNGTNDLAFRSAMFGGATCEQTKYRLNAGTYLPAGKESVEQCVSGAYCPGADNITIDANNNQGIVACPSGYPKSDIGAKADTQCYTDCTAQDVEHAMTVVGNDYYGDGNDMCMVTDCVSGWHVKLGLNLEELVGSTYEGSNSSYMDGTNSAYINNAGDFVEYGQYEEYGQEYYGISENNSFAVIYDDDKGMITGRARCSSQSENSVENLPDESGNSDAYNCYCTIDSYTPVDGTKQTVSAPWIKYGSINWYPGACESNCVQNCASNMREYTHLDFRGKMFDASYELPMCLANKININWNLGYGDNNVSTTTCSYADVIEYPTDPVRPGYTFTGWKLVE